MATQVRKFEPAIVYPHVGERPWVEDWKKLVKTRMFGGDWWWYYPVTPWQVASTIINLLREQAWDARPWLLQGGIDIRTYEIQDWWWMGVEYLWPKDCARPFVRTPWAEQMAYEAFRQKYLALSGCASSGKTEFGAVWALTEYLCKPPTTLCLVTSTSLEAARKRIWGSIKEFYLAMTCEKGMTRGSKLVDSMAKLKARVPGENGWSDKAGIQLVACEHGKDNEAIGKLIGMKQHKVVVVADELPELSESILNAALGNLNKNPQFQLIGIGNHKSIVDAFGKFSEPKEGWRSVDVGVTRWETKLGVCVRFDGAQSPNLRYKEDRWPIYGNKQYREDQAILGPNSVLYWRMVRSFPAPAGVTETVYSDAEIVECGALDGVRWGSAPLVQLAALDPAFTSGGDRSAAVFGQLGQTEDGRTVLLKAEHMALREDVTVKKPYDWQVAMRFKEECEKRGIPAKNVAFDATGSGISFGTLLAELWSDEPLAVKFGGAASDNMVVSGDTLKRADEVYGNRVTELWYQGKEYMRSRQLAGLTLDIAEEMTSRNFKVQKGAETRVTVEPKADMKVRMGKSPDLADAYFILLELARTRFGFYPQTNRGRMGFGLSGVSDSLQERCDLVYGEEALLVES